MQPGELTIDESFGTAGYARNRANFRFFLFSCNDLYRFHKVLIHLKSGRSSEFRKGEANHV
jgi:hypothetical protein